MPDTKTLPYYLAFRRAYPRKHIPDLLLIEMSLFDFPIPPNIFPIDNIWWILGVFRLYYYTAECRPCKINSTTGNIDFENKSYYLDTISGNYRLVDYNNLNVLLNTLRYIMIKPIGK